MNPVLTEIYSTILPYMPFVIGAYVLMWVVLVVYILIIATKTAAAQKQLTILEEQLEQVNARS
jgi:hypothetical protein